MDYMVKELEDAQPNQFCPLLKLYEVAQAEREQIRTFMNKDAYRLIDASSRLIDKVIAECDESEDNEFSIEMLQTLQDNFLKPILGWHGWKVSELFKNYGKNDKYSQELIQNKKTIN